MNNPDLWEMTMANLELQEKWDRRFLFVAKEISRWSKDPSTQVGAVIANDLGQIVGSGYNGFPRGVWDSDERLFNKDMKYKLMCHAEQNAVWMAGEKARGCSIYVWPPFDIPNVCHECAKAVVQSGIKRVVGFKPTAEESQKVKHWKESIDLARMILTEAGVKITEVRS